MLTAGEFLTPCITKLELLAHGKVIGNATGFFLKRGAVWHIVTNWHVFSGRDNATGQPRRDDCAVPDTCRFWSSSQVEAGLKWSLRKRMDIARDGVPLSF